MSDSIRSVTVEGVNARHPGLDEPCIQRELIRDGDPIKVGQGDRVGKPGYSTLTGVHELNPDRLNRPIEPGLYGTNIKSRHEGPLAGVLQETLVRWWRC